MNLGEGTKKAGDCRLLQVVFSHPTHPDSTTMANKAKQGHPLATVNIQFLEPEDSDLGQTIMVFASDRVQRCAPKRKSPGELKGASPRKQRRGTDSCGSK